MAEARITNPRQARDLALVSDYLIFEFPGLASKTRSIIVSTFTSLIDALSRGVLHELFCTSTNVTPQVTERGYIILIDLPIKLYGEIGIIGQAILKYCFQWSIERRDVRKNPRGVFLIGDEAQYFVTPKDAQFQTTCRSSRVAVFWLGQNCPGFYEALGGGEKGRAAADALFAGCSTKFFCANSCPVTNSWASTLAGNTRKLFMNVSQQSPRGDWYSQLRGQPGDAVHIGMSEQISADVEPVEFSKMATGGRRNRGRVETVVMQTGRVFTDTGRTWRPHTFRQRLRRWWQFWRLRTVQAFFEGRRSMQQYVNSVAERFRRSVNGVGLFCEAGAVTLQFLMHREFGERYILGWRTLFGGVLIGAFWMGWDGYERQPLELYGWTCALLAVCHLALAFDRRRRGKGDHSFYNGWPMALPEALTRFERPFKVVVEPALAYVAGMYLREWNQALGCYVMFAAGCLFFNGLMLRAVDRRRRLDIEDAMVEQGHATQLVQELEEGSLMSNPKNWRCNCGSKKKETENRRWDARGHGSSRHE